MTKRQRDAGKAMGKAMKYFDETNQLLPKCTESITRYGDAHGWSSEQINEKICERIAELHTRLQDDPKLNTSVFRYSNTRGWYLRDDLPESFECVTRYKNTPRKDVV